MWKWIKWAYKHTIVYFQEIVLGWAWVAFAFLGGHPPLISTLQVEYPTLASMFEFAFLTAGILLLVAVAKQKLFFPAFVFSSFVAVGAFWGSIGVIGVDAADASLLYPATWALFAFVSITQAIRHWHDWDDPNGD